MSKKDGPKAAFSPRTLGTTRGKILVLLCRRHHTVAELAAELGVTRNAVRAQLDRFQRDGLVSKAGSRQGVRKPHVEYELTARARQMFPKAYEPVLRKLVDVLTRRLSKAVVRKLFRESARQLFDDYLGELRTRTPRERLAEIMTKLHGSSFGIELAEQPGKAVIRSCGCPLASVTASHPEFCELVASTVRDILGADVREQCEKGDVPRCCFEVMHS
jgi:predicted ArsR family transcriptional regulator